MSFHRWVAHTWASVPALVRGRLALALVWVVRSSPLNATLRVLALAQEGTPVEGVPERAGALLRVSSVHAQALGTPRGAPGSAGLGSASAPVRAARSRLSAGSGWASEPRAGGAPGSAGLGSDFARRSSGSAERPSETGAALPAGPVRTAAVQQVSGQAVHDMRMQHSLALQRPRHICEGITCAPMHWPTARS